MLFASRICKPRKGSEIYTFPFFYLGSDDPTELSEYLYLNNMTGHTLTHENGVAKYVVLPAWMQDQIVRAEIEIVKVSEFDLRICSMHGGIPSLDTQGRLFESQEGAAADNTENSDKGEE